MLLPPVTAVKSLSMLGLRVPPAIADSSGGNEVWRKGWAERAEVVEEPRFCRLLATLEDMDGRFLGLGRGM